MKKANNAKWFIIGVAVCFLLTTVVFPVAAQTTRQANLLFRDISITLDGETLVPVDVHGNAVEPFIIDGTTYLPVRAISNALGLDVDWDDATSTVILTSTPTPATATPAPTPTAVPTPTPTAAPTPTPAPTAQSPLVGTWGIGNTPFYVLNANGTGTFSGDPIRWTATNTVLSICVTPGLCGSNCIAPVDWNFTLVGNVLTLTSSLLPDLPAIILNRL